MRPETDPHMLLVNVDFATVLPSLFALSNQLTTRGHAIAKLAAIAVPAEPGAEVFDIAIWFTPPPF